MRWFAFYWSPEGRRLCTYRAATREEAVAVFKRNFPEHAQYMGEVYTKTGATKEEAERV